MQPSRTVTKEPTTLGEKLAPRPPNMVARMRAGGVKLVKLGILLVLSVLLTWWIINNPDMNQLATLTLCTALTGLWVLAYKRPRGPKLHSLLANDRNGAMHNLRLDAKTAIIDGSNIYHLGHENGLDAQPLGMIANQLRNQGYRIVCFFDANIYFTLSDHDAFPRHQRHSQSLLEDIFGLTADEVYVVPSGVQADQFILESLDHLPISFAVTNDQFRDYADLYPDVMKDKLWRKGVVVSGDDVKLQNHRF